MTGAELAAQLASATDVIAEAYKNQAPAGVRHKALRNLVRLCRAGAAEVDDPEERTYLAAALRIYEAPALRALGRKYVIGDIESINDFMQAVEGLDPTLKAMAYFAGGRPFLLSTDDNPKTRP